MESILFDLIFEPMQMPVMQIDKNKVIVNCNQASSQYLGYAKNEINSQPLTTFFRPHMGRVDFLDSDNWQEIGTREQPFIFSSPAQTTAENQPVALHFIPFSQKATPGWVVLWQNPTSAFEVGTQGIFLEIQHRAPLTAKRLFDLDLSEKTTYQILVDYLAFLLGTPLCALSILGAEAAQNAGFFISGNTSLQDVSPETLSIIHKAIEECARSPVTHTSLEKHRSQNFTVNQLPQWISIPQKDIEFIPILSQSRCFGLLIFQIMETKPVPDFLKEELVSYFAQLLASYLQNKHLTNLEKKQRKQAKILRELLQIRNTSLDHATVLDQILDQLGTVVDYDSACIMLISEADIILAAQRRFRVQEQLEIPLVVKNYPHIQQVLEEKSPVIIKDTHQDNRWYRMPNTDYIRCWLGVPLIARDRVLGLLNLDKTQPNYYTEEDAELALIFANQAAIAIENAQLYDYERQRVHQLDTLRTTVTELSSELELSILLRTILERAIGFLNATGGDLGLFDGIKQEIVILTSINMGKDYKNTRMGLGEGAMGLAVQTKSTISVKDYQNWSNASSQYSSGKWHAVIATPFLIGDRVVGAIGIMDEKNDRQFSDSDQTSLKQFAEHAAIAVENATLFKNAKEASDRQMILHRVSQEIVSASLDSEGIYEAIHQAAAQLMPAEAFALTLLDESNHTIQAVYLIDRSGRAPLQTIPSTKGLSGHVIQTGDSIYIQDTHTEVRYDIFHFGDPDQVRSVLAVPMRRRGKVIGMLSAQSYLPDAYKAEDQHLLEMLASYAAIALDNLKLFREIQKLAITDPLTNLFNRRHLFALGQREFSRARRLKRPLTLLLLDIDHFKEINDAFGHKTGDFVLKKLAQIIKTYTREIDILGRYGGEEFVIALVETSLEEACNAAERLRTLITQNFQSDTRISHLTVSIGIAEIKPTTNSFYHLIDEADTALYQAKKSGRNQVKIYTNPE